MLIGPKEIAWDHLATSSKFLRHSQWYIGLTQLAAEAMKYEDHTSLGVIGLQPHTISNARETRDTLDLETLLTMSRSSTTTNPRDHVYAILVSEIRMSTPIQCFTKRP